MLAILADAAAGISTHDVPGYAVGWGTLSLLNAGLAQSKNHSGLLWWFVSLFLGPIATFIIVAILDNQEVRERPRSLKNHADTSPPGLR